MTDVTAQPTVKFSDLKLDPRVLTAVQDAGYETPTPIQAGAIPPALEGRDVLGIAQTGTGKTASFTLPMITLLGRGRARARMPRSLVLCPTRELAAQVAENFEIYAKHTRLTKALLIGGVSFGEQDKLIDRGVDVLIATPGRLLDHFERGKLLLTGVQIMVVDEADRMLDMGFIPDIERIFQLTPFTRQTLFFSATMAPEIERITNTFLHSPERVEVARQATASETITQRLLQITPARRDQAAKQKRELLRAVIEAEGPPTEDGGLKNAIIFCNRKTEVDIVAKSLKKHGFDAAPIHGDLDQSQRTRTLEGFRDGTLRFLIASDVAARGLDIPAVSHVFNFDLPSHAEDYVHRIGRTGRAGRQGTAISLATPADEKYLLAIEDLVKQELPRGDLPAGFASARPDADEDGGSDAGNSRRGSRGRDRGRDKGRGRGRNAGSSSDEPNSSDASQSDGRQSQGHPQADAVRDPAQQDQPDVAVETKPEVASPEPMREETRESGADGNGSRDRQTDRQNGRDNDAGRRDGGRARDADGGRGRETNRRGGARDGGRDGGRDGAVVGMGEHVPDFMLSSFEPAYNDRGAGSDREGDQEVEVQVATDDDAPAKPKRATRSRSRSKAKPEQDSGQTTEESSADAPQSDAPVPDGQAEVADGEAAEKPAPKPRRRASRAKKADADAPADTAPDAPVSDAGETTVKPRRTRRKKTDEPVDVSVADTDAPAPKPRRSRRKKADPASEDNTGAASSEEL